VNVTEAPGQAEVADALIVSAGVTVGRTETAIEPEVSLAGEGQLALEVMMQYTACPVVSVEVM